MSQRHPASLPFQLYSNYYQLSILWAGRSYVQGVPGQQEHQCPSQAA